MKKLTMMFAALFALCAFAEIAIEAAAANQEQPSPEVELAAKEAVVKAVYGEDAQSSFIVKTELTATQKRFIAIGQKTLALALVSGQLQARIDALEGRVAELEAKLDERDQRRLAAARERQERKRTNDEKVRRAIERAGAPVKKGAK